MEDCQRDTEDEAQKKEGMKGRIAVLREQQRQEKQGAYENVSRAKKALAEKQDSREQRQSLAVARGSGEVERKDGKILGKRTSILKYGRKSADASARNSADTGT